MMEGTLLLVAATSAAALLANPVTVIPCSITFALGYGVSRLALRNARD